MQSVLLLSDIDTDAHPDRDPYTYAHAHVDADAHVDRDDVADLYTSAYCDFNARGACR